jgi:hypothetical protein
MENLKNIRLWVRGLVAAVIGGAANAVTTVVVAPEMFNFREGLGKLGAVTAASALVSAAMYLKQSPVPTGDREQPQ